MTAQIGRLSIGSEFTFLNKSIVYYIINKDKNEGTVIYKRLFDLGLGGKQYSIKNTTLVLLKKGKVL